MKGMVTIDEHFIRVEHVDFKYAGAEEDEMPEVLSDVSLTVKKGEFLALLGHNGSGKSTLAKHFNAMLVPTAGKVFVDGMDTSDESLKFEIRSKVGLVLQNPVNQLVASIVEEDVAFGPENLGVPPEEIRRRVDNALKTVEMYEYREHAPHKLSGGQKQRVAIAGILAMQPACIVLDEPTAMLDPRGRREVLDTVGRLNREQGITIILITHNMDEAILANRVVVMDNGRPVLEGTPREVFSQVERMKQLRLDVPQATELAYLLQQDGFPLPDGILDETECAGAIARLLEKAASTDGGCAVRPMEESDLSVLQEWLSDPAVLEWYEGRDRKFDEKSIRAAFWDREPEVHACILMYQGKPAGYLQYYPLSPKAAAEEYGFQEEGAKSLWGMDLFIGVPSLWGKGLGRRFLTKILDYLTKSCGADAVLVDPHAGNGRAIKCYESCGFQKVALLPCHEMHEGTMRDCWLMAYRPHKNNTAGSGAKG